MNKNYYELKITTSLAFEREIISSFLMDNYCEAIEEVGSDLFVRSEDNLEDEQKALNQFAKNLEFDVKSEIVIKKNQDWIDNYKKAIKPIEVSKFYIYPSWENEKNGFINIKIDPALAFGSGHHESTNGCLEAISLIGKKDMSGLDVGCGSGILAIALAKLGVEIDFCDTDEVAIDSTKTNFKQNYVKYNTFWIGSANITNKKYDIVIANIIAEVLIIIKKDLKKALNDGGYLVLSGILDKYIDNIRKNFADLTFFKEIKKNEWYTIILKKEIDGK